MVELIEKHILWSSNSSISRKRANLNNLCQPPSLLSLAQQVKAESRRDTGSCLCTTRWREMGWGGLMMLMAGYGCEGNKSIACWGEAIFSPILEVLSVRASCHSPVEPHWMKMWGVEELVLELCIKSFKGEIIYLFSQCLLSTYYMPDTSLGTG